MSQLDSREFVLAHDPKGMLDLTAAFASQCQTALDLTEAANVNLGGDPPQNIVISGLGGSAAGGDVCRAVMELTGSIPLAVSRDYFLPGYVGPGTLVFVSSYSGNTEETLASYEDAKRRGARIVGVTSGGQLAAKCLHDGFPCVVIPSGQPPRTAMGFMLIPVLLILESNGLIPNQGFTGVFEVLRSCAAKWGQDAPFAINPAKQLAQELYGTFPILYGLGLYQGLAAYRWKGQINENAKVMAYSHALPEMNHNELMGWQMAETQGVAAYTLVFLQDGSESAKMKERKRVTSMIVGSKAKILEANAAGATVLERALSLVYLGDFVSLYLAALNRVDPETIDAINVLKSALAKIS